MAGLLLSTSSHCRKVNMSVRLATNDLFLLLVKLDTFGVSNRIVYDTRTEPFKTNKTELYRFPYQNSHTEIIEYCNGCCKESEHSTCFTVNFDVQSFRCTPLRCDVFNAYRNTHFVRWARLFSGALYYTPSCACPQLM